MTDERDGCTGCADLYCPDCGDFKGAVLTQAECRDIIRRFIIDHDHVGWDYGGCDTDTRNTLQDATIAKIVRGAGTHYVERVTVRNDVAAHALRAMGQNWIGRLRAWQARCLCCTWRGPVRAEAADIGPYVVWPVSDGHAYAQAMDDVTTHGEYVNDCG